MSDAHGSVDRKAVIELLRRRRLSEDKIIHSEAVADLALALARQMMAAGQELDLQVVELGGLLHDIGITHFGERDFEAEMSAPIPSHCVIGAAIVLEEGYSQAVAHCVESHELWLKEEAEECRFPAPVKDYVPQTPEAKAVAYADIVVFAAIEEGFDLWKEKDAVVRTYHHYFGNCYRNLCGRQITAEHPLVQRVEALHRQMLPYLTPQMLPKAWRSFTRQAV